MVSPQSMDNWESQVRKGVLEFFLLELLESLGQSYGYELLQRLKSLPSMTVTESAVYPILSRATKEGIVTVWQEKSPSGPPRRWYRLTDFGQTRLEQMRVFMKDLERSLKILRGSSEEGGDQASIHHL